MRVFLDTNVLVSAFTTRGLCADVVRHVLTEHILLVGEVVLDELRRVLREKIHLPEATIHGIEQLLQEQEVVPRPGTAAGSGVRDPDDAWILASAIEGHADILVTGDRDLLELSRRLPFRIVDPRGFWALVKELPPRIE